MRVKLKKQFAFALLALVLCVPVRAELFGPWNVTLDVPRGGLPPAATDSPPYNGTSTGGPGGLDSFLQDYTLTLTFQGTDVSTIRGALTLYELPGTPVQSIDLSTGFTTSDNLTYSATFGSSSALAGYNPNTTWTLDLFDSRGAGPENTLLSWQLHITAVPEPSEAALVILGGAWLLGSCCRRDWAGKLLRRPSPSFPSIAS
jgi:hypothetical protein